MALLAVTALPASATDPANTPSDRELRPNERLDPVLFPLPDVLRDNVALWTRVYSRYDSTVVLLHDNWHTGVVYAAIDFSKLEEASLSPARQRAAEKRQLRETRAKYSSILRDLAAGRRSETWPRDQERIERMFADVPGGRRKYTEAIERLRTQRCLRERFAEGLKRSGLYLPAFERIFTNYGLPTELARLPFVESLFQEGARSKAAAGGVWQFVPSTAKSYLRMTPEADERFDPLVAADAAARLLRDNHDALGTWPLALTAYNHGRSGMKRAVRQTGTRDLGTITQRYRSRLFGFASRNFYSEFYSAATIYANREHYFPDVEPLPPLAFEEFVPDRYVSVPALAKAADVDLDDVRSLNRGLSREIWTADLYLPRGYLLRVPDGALADVQSAYGSLEERASRQIGLSYRVRRGDTLGRIARRYGSSVRALQRANGLASPNRIRVGQALRIPSSGAAASAARPTASSPPATHVVRRGDTLSKIAGRYGTTVRALQRANGLANIDSLRVGQRLQVPRGGQITHVVRSGDTLAVIARRYGTTVKAIQRANGLRTTVIRPSQTLIIP